MTLSDADRELLEALVGWYEIALRPWRIRDDVWDALVAADMVARAPERHVYPLPRGIHFVHRSVARRP